MEVNVARRLRILCRQDPVARASRADPNVGILPRAHRHQIRSPTKSFADSFASHVGASHPARAFGCRCKRISRPATRQRTCRHARDQEAATQELSNFPHADVLSGKDLTEIDLSPSEARRAVTKVTVVNRTFNAIYTLSAARRAQTKPVTDSL